LKVFWRFIELVLGTAPSPGTGSAFYFFAFVAMPAGDIRFTPSGEPEVPRQGWLLRRSLTIARDVLCCVAASTALGVLTQPSALRSYVFAVLFASILSLIGSCDPLQSRALFPACLPACLPATLRALCKA